MSKQLEAVVSIAGNINPSLSRSIKKATDKLSGLNAKALAIGAAVGAGAAAIGKAVFEAGKYLADLGGKFDKAEDAIRIGTGATGDALSELTDSFSSVYSSVPTTMANASKAIADYNTRLGLTGKGLEDISVQAIQVAGMLGEDLGGVIEASSQSFRIFGLDADRMAGSMDWLFKVSQSTGIGFTELTALVQRNGAAFQQMGFTFDESAAMLGRLEKAGYDTSAVMTAMTYAVKASANMGLKGKAAYEQYYDSIRNAKDETEAIGLAMELFGARSGTVMAQAIRDGSLAMDDFMGELAASSETIRGAAEDTYDFAEILAMLKQKAEVALKPLANSVFRLINDLMPVLTRTMDSLIPIIENMTGKLIPIVEKIVPGVMPLVDELLPEVLEMAAAVAEELIPPVMEIATAILPVLLQLVRMLTPILKTVVAGIMPFAVKLVQQLLPVLTQIINAVLPVLTELLDDIMPLLSPVMDVLSILLERWLPMLAAILQRIAEVAGKVLGGAVRALTGLIQGVVDAIRNVIAWFERFGSNAADAFTGAWGKIKSVWSAASGWFSANITGPLSEKFSSLWNRIGSSASAAWEGIKNTVRGAIDRIKSLFSFRITWPHIPVPHFSIAPPKWKVGDLLKGSFPKIGIDWYAKGGILDSPTLFGSLGGSLLGGGESGKEAVLPLDTLWDKLTAVFKAVLSAEQGGGYTAQAGRLVELDSFSLAELSGNSGGPTVVYDFSGFTWSPTVEGGGSEDDIMTRLREHEAEFFDWLEEFVRAREVSCFG